MRHLGEAWVGRCHCDGVVAGLCDHSTGNSILKTHSILTELVGALYLQVHSFTFDKSYYTGLPGQGTQCTQWFTGKASWVCKLDEVTVCTG